MEYDEAKEYNHTIETVQVYRNSKILEYLKLRCPHCDNEGWVYNGNIRDMTMNDVENARCNVCNEEFFITYMDEWMQNGEIGVDSTEMEPMENFSDLRKDND